MIEQRRFPSRAETPKQQSEASTLLTLGRRVERLFFIGFLVSTLSFAAWYFNAAAASVTQDSAYAAINSLSKRIREKQADLSLAYQQSNAQHAPPATKPRAMNTKALRDVAATRRMLGLPPETEVIPVKAPPAKSYEQSLNEILIDSEVYDKIDSAALNPYRRPDLSPDALLAALSAARLKLDAKPIQAWGISTRRSFELNYYGSAFEFPFQFISKVSIVLLCPLVAGWLTTLYMTRQREIQEIKGANDIALVFPHILNFLPIHFQSWGKITPAALAWSAVGKAVMRLAVILVIVFPMLLATVGALVAFAQYSAWNWLLTLFLIYISIQTTALLILETFSFGKKYFAEP